MPGSEPLRRHPELAVVESADRVTVLHLDHLAEPPLVLSGSGVAVWEAVDGRRTLAEVVEAVAASYGLEVVAVEAEVRVFVEELVGRGVLVVG